MGVNIVKLKDVVDILNGYAFKSSKYVKSGHRVMRITNVQKGILVDDDPKYYEQSNDLNKYELKIGDILISLTGNVGRVGMVEEQILPAYLNQGPAVPWYNPGTTRPFLTTEICPLYTS